jgi:hypothetical protein
MNRTWCAVVLSLLVVTLSAPALAQDTTAKKVTLDLNGVAPAAAFKAVAEAMGVSVTVDAAVTDPVDITVRNVSARTALNAVCESIGCRWTLMGKTLVVKPEAEVKVGVVMRGDGGATVDKTNAKARAQVVLAAFKQKLPPDMNFENAPLDVVNKRLGEALKMNVLRGRHRADADNGLQRPDAPGGVEIARRAGDQAERGLAHDDRPLAGRHPDAQHRHHGRPKVREEVVPASGEAFSRLRATPFTV